MTKSRDYDVYTEYYLNQAGCGYSSVYSGPIYQKGNGIGSFLGGLFRCAFPLLKKTSTVVGAEILKSGCNVISDIGRNEDINFSIKKRGKETINNLTKLAADRMFGAGYSINKTKRQAHSSLDSGNSKKRKIIPTKKHQQKSKPKNKKPIKKKVGAKQILTTIFFHNGIHQFA